MLLQFYFVVVVAVTAIVATAAGVAVVVVLVVVVLVAITDVVVVVVVSVAISTALLLLLLQTVMIHFYTPWISTHSNNFGSWSLNKLYRFRSDLVLGSIPVNSFSIKGDKFSIVFFRFVHGIGVFPMLLAKNTSYSWPSLEGK